MSRQIQIRRGTATEHEAFTGAVGEITMDTTNNTIRVHDGQTPGGTPLAKQSDIPQQQTLPDNYDFVVESQLPSAQNNYTWYRKYKSGWVEQGGEFTPIINGSNSWNNYTVILPVQMSDAHYCVIAGDTGIASSGTAGTIIEDCTTTSFKWCYFNASSTARCYWRVSGVRA